MLPRPHRWLALTVVALASIAPAGAQETAQPGSSETRPPAPAAAASGYTTVTTRVVELMKAGRWADAVPLAVQSLELAHDAHDTPNAVATASYHLGYILRRLDRTAEARTHLRRAYDLIAATPAGLATRLFHNVFDEFVQLAFEAGDGHAVAALYTDALAAHALRIPQGSMAHAKLLDDWGTAARRLGRFADAEAAFKRALAMKETVAPADGRELARSLNNLAGVLRFIGRYDAAEPAYVRAIAAATAGRDGSVIDDVNVGIMTDNLAVLHVIKGEPQKAEPLHRRAIEIFEARLGPDHPTTGVGVGNLAELYRQLGRYDEALPLYQRAHGILLKAGVRNDQRLATISDNMAGIFRERREYELALRFYRQALTIFEAVYPKDHPTVGVSINNIGLTLLDQGRLDDADGYLQRAHAIAENAYDPTNREIATSLTNIADLRSRQRRHAEAADLYGRALAINEAVFGATHERLIAPATRQARALLAAGDAAAALPLYRRAFELQIAERTRRSRAPGARDSDARPEPGLHAGLIETLWSLSANGTDTALAGEALTVAQWLSLSGAASSVQKLGARLAAGDAGLAAKARLREDLAAERTVKDRELIKATSEPADRRNMAAETGLRDRLAAIDGEIAALDAEIAHAFPAYAALVDPRPLSIADVRGHLRSTEALVQIVPGLGSTFTFVVTREAVRLSRSDLTPAATDRMVAALRCGLDLGNWVGDVAPQRCLDLVKATPDGDRLPFDTAIAATLYAHLLKPVEDITAGKELLFVAAGAMAGLPPHVLVTAPPAAGAPADFQTVAWLARRQPVTILASVPSLAALRAAAPPASGRRPYLGIANPLLLGAGGDDRRAFAIDRCPPQPRPGPLTVASRGPLVLPRSLVRGGSVDAAEVRKLEPLPESADEVCRIAAALGAEDGSVMLGALASETALGALDAGQRLAGYRVVHFATHGLVAGEIAGLKEPALVLTPPQQARDGDDGLLLASEVALLHLDADWVILSACNTAAAGAGGGEALSGLAQAFFHAGARTLLVSHWPVQSMAAVEITTRVLGDLARTPGLSRAEALRRAMVALIDDTRDPMNAHPQTWAPFVVVGDSAGTAVAAAAPATGASRPVAAPRTAASKATRAKAAPATDDWSAKIHGR